MAYKEYIGCKSIECVDYDGKGNDLYAMWLTDTEIIRCRDCKDYSDYDSHDPCCYHFDGYGSSVEPNGFCAWAERRDA